MRQPASSQVGTTPYDTEREILQAEKVRGRGGSAGENRHAGIEDPDTNAVRVDGDLMEHAPATEVLMAQQYFFF
ncbi:hypothetical protein [Mycolicibacter kumamotonensis]|uniref:hypothetical protein n=1 Tax=Mycolicibacter kumamotonensis TaxID=354243 RepID=UPI00104271AC|nr:hypothetical protein [Mycolicibacter kumamotonensis]